MSEETQGKIRTGVSFDPLNLEWLRSAGNVTQKINEILEAHRTGKIIATGELMQGESGKDCIQPIAAQFKPSICPFRIIYPQLQQASNGLALQEKFCMKCPHYRKDFEAFKVSLRRQSDQQQPSNFVRDYREDVVPKRQHTTSNAFKCKNEGCGKMLAWTKENRRPVEVSTGLEHVCQYYRPAQAAPAQQPEPENSGKRVKCSTCGESLATYMQGEDALDSLLDNFTKHTIDKHQRHSLTEDETRQFRLLREVPTA